MSKKGQEKRYKSAKILRERKQKRLKQARKRAKAEADVIESREKWAAARKSREALKIGLKPSVADKSQWPDLLSAPKPQTPKREKTPFPAMAFDSAKDKFGGVL